MKKSAVEFREESASKLADERRRMPDRQTDRKRGRKDGMERGERDRGKRSTMKRDGCVDGRHILIFL